MNFKSFIVVGLTLATLGMSLPAHAGDTATIIGSDQDAVVTGNDNATGQSSSVNVRNRERGRSDDSTGTVVNHRQTVDVLGHGNVTAQEAAANVGNNKDTRHNRRRY